MPSGKPKCFKRTTLVKNVLRFKKREKSSNNNLMIDFALFMTMLKLFAKMSKILICLTPKNYIG
jgi:hypothetical protein